jgi:hypothetical protein
VAIGTGSLCVGIALRGGIAVHGRLNVVDMRVFCMNSSVCVTDVYSVRPIELISGSFSFSTYT